MDKGGLYTVRTWDGDLQEFTPQEGVDPGPHTPAGLRDALRQLKEYGYSCDRGDCSVLVERVN